MGPVSSDAVNRYLKQTRELFGDELFLEKKAVSLTTGPTPINSDYPSDLVNFLRTNTSMSQLCIG